MLEVLVASSVSRASQGYLALCWGIPGDVTLFLMVLDANCISAPRWTLHIYTDVAHMWCHRPTSHCAYVSS